MSNNKKKIESHTEKNLPDVFKELKESQAKMRQVQKREEEIKRIKKERKNKKHTFKENVGYYIERIKDIGQDQNYDYDFDNITNNYGKKNIIKRNKFNTIGIIIGILFIIGFISIIKSNAIYAKSSDEVQIIGSFEKNSAPIDLMAIASTNLSEISKKEIITERYVVEREYEYIPNTQLPKDEQVADIVGQDGIREVTYIRSYEEDQLTNEKIVGDAILQEPIKAVIEVGTSNYLSNRKAHVGDTLYTKEEISMYNDYNEESLQICKIYEHIDVKLMEISDETGWARIIVDGMEGYVKAESLTSVALNPEMPELARIKRLMVSLAFNMPLNKPSGLTREDFKKVLSNNPQDVNKIFENSAEFFYELEQKYNINGIFLASIGVHESAWGTSTIANDKKNLFGYGAYDRSPYASSFTFDTYEEGMETLAKVLVKYYLNEKDTPIYDGETATGSYYNGPTVSGVNTRYASDKEWCNKVYAYMVKFYQKLEE